MSAEDDIQKSRSYYRAELETAKAMLAPGADLERMLVVVDELFRGTNTSERIGAGAALLDALHDAGNFVFASTHDGELVPLLRDRFDPYHFAEQVVGGEIIFPFELCRGPATTRNAIALLRQVGFPPAVVARATEIAEGLDRVTRAVRAPGA
jgi:DNA mismatch repair ATPase MutS